MAEKKNTVVLYSPTGDKYETSSVAEVTRLESVGYSQKKPTPKQVEAASGGTKS